LNHCKNQRNLESKDKPNSFCKHI